MLRLLLFVALLLAVTVALAPLAPPMLPWAALPSLVGALVAGWMMLRLDGRSPGTLGYALSGRGAVALKGSVLGLVLGAGIGLFAVALIAAVGGVRWQPDSGGWASWLRVGAGSLWLLAIPAAAEEAMLRGYPLLALNQVWGPGRAIVITAVAFALLHLANPAVGWIGLANIAAAGLFLGALCIRTGGLWWPTGAHLGWNWTHAFVADLPVSGLDLVDAPLIEPAWSGPTWLSGGAFGPEGSVLATGAVLAAAIWTWRTPYLSGRVRAAHTVGWGDVST